MDALTFLSEHVALFAGVPADELASLAVNSTLLKLAPGQTAVRAGFTLDALYVIATGTAEVHAKVPNKGVLKVGDLRPGEVFGETSILDQTVASATVKAGEGGAIVLVVPEEPFHALIAANAAFGERVRALVAARRQPPPKA
ncbi:MAG TPA: cyclic nucleotide-binding domain-containing protein [Elusimicrobiota bacterium]|nr:cyclic nucleotide-binding domain-containing protein [Elusimicrobiota bacterium]